MTRTLLTVIGVALCAATLSADRLYLRNGREVQGQLVSVRGGTIEFEEAGGWGRPRVTTFDRREVRSIEFDDRSGPPPSDGGWGGNDRPGSGGGWGGGSRPGMREREVVVNADNQWTDTGIDVRGGQSVYFNTQGRIRWGKDRRDGPEGEDNSPRNPNRPIPNRPGGALIGRIGNDVFFVGADNGPFQMRSSGRLYLGINDDYLQDNSGNFRVVVSY